MSQKEFRRIVGFVARWLQRLDVEAIADPRAARGKRWQMRQVLGACLLGLMAGCKSLAELESLTGRLSLSMRRVLRIPRRLPDTTMRDVLCRLSWEQLVSVLRPVVWAARRSKMLEPVMLPFDMAAMDGKATALPSWEGPYAQKHQADDGLPYGLMRTVTATLVTARGRPCIDVSPIPASTNEMGHFQAAFERLRQAYRWVTLVSYDQGANGAQNAAAVVEAGKHYLFRLNDERRHMQQLATDLLATKEVTAQTVDVVSNREEHVRRLRLFKLTRSSLPLACRSEIWEHTLTLLSVEALAKKHGEVVTSEMRYFASSLPADALTAEQWLWGIRQHWGVETTHQILDTSFEEDDRPWIRNDPNGMLVVAVLRRIAYTLLTLYRSVTQRSGDKRRVPWRALFELVRDALIASTAATVASLRQRKALRLTAIAV